ncbi:glycoside hydrolase family 17 protein [Xylaria bambusicola]|uniref:glycoside hydrolase family 17 protein n=1 Tax=Xylaria bambusicola TaxID=326684 RepID=UPI002007328E|nr:glycoside hydrolase family 17 protein [Xylaria bambusicola]KAI0515249.1 glycoside hydrolase family 17 protein [Xylaria bambusicola]
MKATLAVAALAAGVSAGSVHHRHIHAHAKKGYEAEDTCGCTTVYSTYYGEPTLIFPPAPSPEPTTASSTQVVVPTPIPQTCPTTGVYTFPATTITLTDSTTVAVPYTTSVPAGTHTLGGVTTVVTTATTVVCPYATVSTSEGVTTSVIESTTYVCPSAGTYTIAPTTTTVTEDTTVTIPSVTSYPAGTYTQPEVVTTVYETSTVVYCPFDIPTPSSSSVETYVAETTPVETPVYVPETTSTPVVETPIVETPVEVPTYPVTTSVPEPSTTSSKHTPKPTQGSPGKTPAKGTPGKPWAVTYTPYQTTPGGGCKSQGEVNSDIAAIAAAGVTTIRVYSTDCSTLEFVGGACEAHGIKMILGIYVDEPGCDAGNPSVTEQISSIKAWGKWNLVSLITVGNEAVLHGFCTPSELAGLISTTKEQLSYTGPYSTAETVNIWQQEEFSSLVCPVVDFVGANAHAFFNTETTADQAGQFVKGQLDIIDNICAGKEGRVMETGWPNAGQALGLAVPGASQQAVAIKSIVKELGDKAVIFSLTSDAWKDGNTQCQCEQHWGCASVLGINM